ncbi:hypothetical protein F383_31917 [Gossypium arboreum]|uniref:Uncharacterized protein n=1 Tax=Gossypium arboreum TaxID=29729 RepID=A0A0B0MUW1_GOSAR|nr:hypothetical protein F383_31917 [Gossypium arboreum]
MSAIEQILTFHSQSYYTFQMYLNRIHIHKVIHLFKCPLNHTESNRIRR